MTKFINKFISRLAFLALFISPRAAAQIYNEELAKELLLYSAAAYANNVDGCLRDPTRIGINTSVVTHIFNQTAYGFAAFGFTAVDKVKERIYIAFRGTNNVEQLIEEFLTSILPVKFLPNNTYLLNPYFYAAEGLIYDDVKAAVTSLMQAYPTYSIFFTGHSLGGAIANVVAFHLGFDGVLDNKRTYFYNFGGPRVGEYPFAKQFNEYLPDAVRVTHYKDVVVHLSPCPSIFGVCTEWANAAGWAYHGKTEVWYPEDMPHINSTAAGNYKICNGVPYGEDATCADSILFPNSIADHLYYFGVRVGYICAAY